jgi:hypothetical protein
VRTRALAPLLLLLAPSLGAAQARVWEVNGVRLESAQVERLARDVATQTVEAARRQPGVALAPEQGEALETIYHEVALDTYDHVVAVVNRSDLDDAAKEAEVKRLVLEGQERSTARVAGVLAPAQYEAYRAWEEQQVEAFRRRGLWSGGRRARRGR